MSSTLLLRAQRGNPVQPQGWIAASATPPRNDGGIVARILLLLTLLFLPTFAIASPLIADLSNYRIDIDSSFNGTRLFLFGARNDNGDILVVIRGPHKDYIVRKKEEMGGMWINKDRMKFYHVPDFYAIASSRPLPEIEQAVLFQRLGIGQKTLLSPPSDPVAATDFSQFADAFLRYQHVRKLYTTSIPQLTFMGETLFKTVIEFPDDIPNGDYTAEIYLVSDGEVVGMQSTPIRVVKSGIDAFIANEAHNHPALYGLSAIVIALSVGWFTGRLFEKI